MSHDLEISGIRDILYRLIRDKLLKQNNKHEPAREGQLRIHNKIHVFIPSFQDLSFLYLFVLVFPAPFSYLNGRLVVDVIAHSKVQHVFDVTGYI